MLTIWHDSELLCQDFNDLKKNAALAVVLFSACIKLFQVDLFQRFLKRAFNDDFWASSREFLVQKHCLFLNLSLDIIMLYKKDGHG